MKRTVSIRRRLTLGALALGLTALAGGKMTAQQPPPIPQFQETASVSVVLVDVVVRDGKGNVVKTLKKEDFTVLEDDKPQRIDTFQFSDIDNAVANAGPTDVALLDNLEDKLRDDVKRAASATETAAAAEQAAVDAKSLTNRRLMALLFDVSSMQPEDVQRAVESGMEFVNNQMTPADVVAVITIGTRLNVLTDFTASKEDLLAALQSLAYSDGTDVTLETVTTAADDAATAETSSDTSSAFEEFNNDVRLRAIKTLCSTLAPIQQKKAVLYFTAGMPRAGDDNAIEQRTMTNTCSRANVTINPVDSRGLTAVVAGGGASQRSSGGQQLFTGANATRGFTQLSRSQEALTTLAADTGGRAFTDSNDFAAAFSKVQNDMASYYLLGYTSTNTSSDGKFRNIKVRLSKEFSGLRVDARPGYWSNKSFANTNRRDRQAQMADQLSAAVSSTDVPMVVGTGWFRRSADSYYVPIAMVVPGSSVPVATGAKMASLDVLGAVRDEQGRTLASPKTTLEVPSDGAETLAGKQVLYQTGVVLPAGQFSVKLVVRENAGGAVGSFEAPVFVPQARESTPGMKVSSVIMSTQVQKAPEGKTDNPLVRDGVQLIPNLTRAVARNQNMYFYYEVYDPALAGQSPQVTTSMAFYRGKVKVFETPIVERTTIDEPTRKAVVFKFEVPATQFRPGSYEVQINVIDAVAKQAAFPRLSFVVQ